MAMTLPLALLLAAAAAEAQDPFALDDGSAAEEPLPVVPLPFVEGMRPEASIVFGGDELLARGYQTLGEALRDLGFVSRRSTTRGVRYDMRGIPGGAALVVDGVAVGLAGEGEVLDVDHGLDLHDVERVEVVRGPASALAGVGALGGVVRVTTRSAGTSGARMTGAAGWLGDGVDLADVGGEGSARFGDVGVRVVGRARGGSFQRWRLDDVPASFVRVESATLPGGRVDRDVMPGGERALTGRAEVTAGALRMDLAVVELARKSPLSTFSHGLLDVAPDVRGERRAAARALYEQDLGWFRVAGALFAGQRDDEERLHLYPPGGSFARGGYIDVVERTATAGAQLRVDVPVTADHRVAAFALAEAMKLDARVDAAPPSRGPVIAALVEHHDVAASASGALEYQGDFGHGWHATTGAVLRWRTGFPLAFAPRAALSFAPWTFLSLRVAYAEGSRTPERYDLATIAQAVILDGADGAAANTHLLPEHVRSLETGVVVRPSSLFEAGLDVFGARHENQLGVVIERGRLLPQNLPARHVVGVEGWLAAEPVPAWISLRVAGRSTWLPLDEPRGENGAALFAGVDVTPLDGLLVGGRGRASLGGDDLAGGARASASVDAYACYRFLEHLTVRASVTDALDAYEQHDDVTALPGAADVTVPAGGRQVLVAIEGRL